MLGIMALDQVKDSKKPEESASEAAAKLFKDAIGNLGEKSPVENKTDAAKPAAQNAKQDATANESSMFDSLSSAFHKTADWITSSTVLHYINPIAASIGAGISLGGELVKVAENLYQSEDKKLTVSKINSQEATKLKNDWDKMFDSDKPSVAAGSAKGSIEFNDIFESLKKPAEIKVDRVSDEVASVPTNQDAARWLFGANERLTSADYLHQFSNEKKEKTEISTEAGHVHVEKSDANGNVRTIVDKTDNKTVVLRDNESVVIENGKEVIKGNGYKVTWDEQNKRHVTLDNGNELVRDGNNVKMNLAQDKLEINPHELKNQTAGFSFVDTKDDLAAKTEEIRKTLGEGQTYLLAIKGVGTRTIFQDGTTFDVQQQKARLETANHQVFHFEIKEGQLYVRKDGELLPITSDKSPIKAVDGKFKIGDLVIDQRELCIKTDGDKPGQHRTPDSCKTETSCKPEPELACTVAKPSDANKETTPAADSCAPKVSPFNVNLQTGEFSWVGKDGRVWHGSINPDGSTQINDGSKKYENNATDSKVKVTVEQAAAVPAATDAKVQPTQPAKPEVTTIDLATTSIDTAKLVDTVKDTTIKDTNTVIHNDRVVEFKDGPTVNPDGSVRVDRDTFIAKDMHVYSRDWESSAAVSSDRNANSIFGSSKAPLTEAQAQTAAINIAQKASSIHNLAKSGVVRWTEVASLNAALGDVLSMMSSVPAGSAAHAMLMQSYSLIINAINVATPKAQAAESANQMGSENKQVIKAIENGASTSDLKNLHRAA